MSCYDQRSILHWEEIFYITGGILYTEPDRKTGLACPILPFINFYFGQSLNGLEWHVFVHSIYAQGSMTTRRDGVMKVRGFLSFSLSLDEDDEIYVFIRSRVYCADANTR